MWQLGSDKHFSGSREQGKSLGYQGILNLIHFREQVIVMGNKG